MAKSSSKNEVFDNSLCSKDCKKNTDSLNSKITDLTDKLFDANNLIYHYKLALAQVESRLVEYKEREVKYCEKIRTLEFHNESHTGCIEILKKKLETLKLEKDRVDGKLAGLLKASKDLDNLIESQRSDKINDGLGYTVVPPPSSQLYLSPKKDLSWTGLPECADDTVTDYSRPSPTVESENFVRKNRACFNCGDFNHLAYDCRKREKKGTSRSQNKTHESFTPRPAAHRPYRPPMRPVRPNMNSARPNKPAHSYGRSPFQETTQDLMIILIQRVQRLERELKARTPIHKVDRGRSRPVMAWVPKKRLLSATITLSNKAEDPISDSSIRAFPGDLSLRMSLSPGNSHWGTLVRDSFPSDNPRRKGGSHIFSSQELSATVAHIPRRHVAG
nr:hypothetical protein [Tanacetum cinerariifolium]